MSNGNIPSRDLADLMRASLPTDEELAVSHRRRLEVAKRNPTCFTHWFPIVESLGIRHPRSVVIDFPDTLSGQVINEDFGSAEPGLRALVAKIRKAGEAFGYPLFMKNSLFSGKHSWANTCFISPDDNDDDIIDKIVNLTHFWSTVGHELALHLVIREFIPTDPVFHAFDGMPVTAEFRLFASDGVLKGWQPYWPKSAIFDADVDDWDQRLATIEEPSSAELTLMRDWAEQLTSRLGGYWSADCLRDCDGRLWLIDMAEGDKSYHCPEGYRMMETA